MKGPVPKNSYFTPNLQIRVIGEHTDPRGRVICYIESHPFFKSRDVARSRVVMTDILRRPLLRTEYIHHKDGNKSNDSPENLKIQTPGDHNREHKLGARHTTEARERISESLRLAYAEGRR